MDFEESVAALTAKEAAKIEQALIDLEDRIYTPVKEKEPAVVEEEEKERDVYRDYMESAMVGYSAHTEEVTDEEVALWQKNFSYLNIRGEALLELDPEYEKSKSQQESLEEEEKTHFYPMQGDRNVGENKSDEILGPSDDIHDLRICGSALKISKQSNNVTSCETEKQGIQYKDEILYSDGILEEMLHIDMRPITPVTNDIETDDVFVDPQQCQQSEVINSLVDVLFPEVVNTSLLPLISNVVRAGREHGVKYVATEEFPRKDAPDNSDDDCMFYSETNNNFFESNTHDMIENNHQDNGGGEFLVIPDGWD